MLQKKSEVRPIQVLSGLRTFPTVTEVLSIIDIKTYSLLNSAKYLPGKAMHDKGTQKCIGLH